MSHCFFLSRGRQTNIRVVFGLISLFLFLFALPVASQIDLGIITRHAPNDFRVDVEEDTSQEFRITATVPAPALAFEIDYIEFYAEGAKGWNRKKRGCFGRPCYTLTRAVEYEWGKPGIYKVTAKVFDRMGTVQGTYAWHVSVGKQLSEEEINQLFEEANRPRAEIKIIKAQARTIRFPALSTKPYLVWAPRDEVELTVGSSLYFQVEAACDDGIESIQFSNREPNHCLGFCETYSVTKKYTFNTVGRRTIAVTVKSKEEVLHEETKWIVNVVPKGHKPLGLAVRVSRVDQDISTVSVLSLSGDYIQTPRVDPGILAPGERFQLEATVENNGSEIARSTNLRFYRSPDATISANDTRLLGVGSSIPSLKVGEEIKVTPLNLLTAPRVPGVYYYGACVDRNCSNAIAITVQPIGLSDLVVGQISVSKDTLGPGDTFTLTATVQNQGKAASKPTRLGFYSSSDPNISTNDIELRTVRIGILNASEHVTRRKQLTAPDEPGIYYYGVCVDGAQGESNSDNNCSGALAITVSTTTNRGLMTVGTIPARILTASTRTTFRVLVFRVSDYFSDSDGDKLIYTARSGNTNVVTVAVSGSYLTLTPQHVGRATVSVTASDGSLTVTQSFTVEVQSGETTQPPQQTQPVQMTQATQPINQSPTAIGRIASQTLRINGDAQRVNVSSYFQDTDGDSLTYTARSDNTNVMTTSVSENYLTLTPLRVGRATVSVTASDGSLTAIQSFTVEVRSGQATQPPQQTQPVQMTQATQPINQSPTAIGRIASQTLRINGDAQRVNVSNYFQDADGDSLTYTAHSDNTNVATVSVSGVKVTLTPQRAGNTTIHITASDGRLSATQGISVTVTSDTPPVQDPTSFDLAIQSVNVSKKNLAPGESFTLSVTIRNNGPSASEEAVLSYYHSTIQGRSQTDPPQLQGTVSLDSLASGDRIRKKINLRAPSTPRAYYYGAWLSANTGDTNLYNDVATEARVTVRAPDPPDLVVESISASEGTVEPGERFRLSATVRNRGAGESRSTTLRYYRSLNASISDSDTEVDTDSVSSLDADETSDKWDNIKAPDTPGTYYFGACVDNVKSESNTNNNCSTAVKIIVEVPGLRVGDAVFAQNTVGGGLNGLRVRRGAGTGFDQIGGVWDGATGTITNGPRTANGYTWWKVRWNASNKVACDENPCEGWSVEFFNGDRIIAKAGLAAPPLSTLIPTEMVLLPNYPNPFNPETWIPYHLAAPAKVTISIYAADGRLVRTLDLEYRPAGVYQNKSRAAYWDGRNEVGEPIASGVYFYTLSAGDFSATRKMLIRK